MTSPPSGDEPVRPNLYGMDLKALAEFLEPLGQARYRAGQLYRWLYHRLEFDPARWTDLSKELRGRIDREARVDPGTIARRTAAEDGTVKYEIALAGGDSVETVYMVFGDRITLCVSSQVGCALGCGFCLTGKMGLRRHLDAGEIAGQIARVIADRGFAGEPFNVVFMGMGEPLHNYDAVMESFRLLTDPAGFGLSWRRITVSTSGLVPAIRRLAAEPSRPRLAVSLNAATDAVRDRIMPVNRKYPIGSLLEACRSFSKRSGERITFEYVLLAGVNDSLEDAVRLSRTVRGVASKVNLIPFNPVPEWLDYRPPDQSRVTDFRDKLLAAGVPTSIRWSRGADARAACGQLALLSDRQEKHR